MHLSIEGVQADALVETGSTHILVSHSLFVCLLCDTTLHAAPVVRSITGHKLAVCGACVVKIDGMLTEV